MLESLEENKDIEMLAELGRLVKRYGADSLFRIAQLIRDPDQAAELATALEYIAHRAPPSKPARKSRSPQHNRVGISVLNELSMTDPQKHSILAAIRHQLITNSILPGMKDIRHFALTHGLTIGTASSRNAAITPLLRSLSKLQTSTLNSIHNDLIAHVPNDRSLERWREVIVRPATITVPRDPLSKGNS